jgi:integrase
MARLTAHQFLDHLGLEGAMTVFIPKGRTLYYVYFRVRLPGTIVTRQFARSCGTDNLEDAKARAAEIFAEEYIKIRTAFKGAKTGVDGSSIPNPSNGSKSSESLPAVSSPAKTDPTIEEITLLYDKWIAAATPGQERPQPQTVKTNKNRLRQLARLVKAETVSELRASMNGLTWDKIVKTEANFVSLLRSAAGPFWLKVMNYYKTQGIDFETPFPTLPKVLKRRFFDAPSVEQILRLKALADKELKPNDVYCYLLFLLALGAGLRLQEAAHVRWEDITPNRIQVRNDSVHRTKTNEDRKIKLGAGLLAMIEEYRRFPLDWVIPDERRSKSGKCPKRRCISTARRLAKWLRIKLEEDKLMNPTHWLRKVFGSVVAQEYGMLAASRYLGHSSIEVTEAVYVGLLDGGPTAHVI